MKKTVNSLMIAVILIAATACSFGQSSVKETRDVSDFDGINFGIAGNLYIKIGSRYQVTVEASDRYIEDIETVVRNNKLYIRKDNNRWFNNEKADVYVTLPELKLLGVSGSGRAEVEGELRTDMLNLSVSGSGRILIPELNSDDMKCSISGSGSISIDNGKVSNADLSISGSGSYRGDDLSISDFQAGISGSGSCTCKVTESLRASISGSGNIYYSGKPPKIDVRSSGSGHVRSR
jgi:hypothetical protein